MDRLATKDDIAQLKVLLAELKAELYKAQVEFQGRIYHMKKELTEEEFKQRFDAGEDPRSLGFDMDNAVVEEPEMKRVNVDFPARLIYIDDRPAASI